MANKNLTKYPITFTIIMNSNLYQLLVLFLAINLIFCKEIYHDFTITYFDGAPDGVPVRILGINKQFPGPTIRASKYDTLIIKVTNLIQDRQSTTIHWHGLEQYLNPWVDGTQMITQCGIPYNSSFVYRFKLLQSGSYWYHSHHTTQTGEGLWGALIIDNTPEAYNYDGELLLAPTPWYHVSGREQASWYMNMSRSLGHLPIPDSTLLNGVGYYPCEYAVRKNTTCNPAFKERYVQFEVERGKTYRLRYFNPSPILAYLLSIDEHKFRLIETDGVDTELGVGVDAVTASTGARDSFLVTMNGDRDQYWIRLAVFMEGVPQPKDIPNINPFPEAFYEAEILAVLKYKDPPFPVVKMGSGKPVMDPAAVQGRPDKRDPDLLLHMQISDDNANNYLQPKTYLSDVDPMRVSFAKSPFPTSQKISDPVVLAYNAAGPLGGEVAPNHVNQTIVINIPDMTDPQNLSYPPGFNNVTFNTSSLDKPAIFKALLGETLPPSLNPIVINGFGSDYVVEVIFSDYGYTGHPIHLHGHTYWIMGRGKKGDGPFREEIHRPLLKSGTRRETVSCLPRSWLVIRFRADNPGLWLLHCHISHHFDLSMGLVIVEGMEQAKKIYKFPKESLQLCKLNGIDVEDQLSVAAIPSPISLLSYLLIIAANVFCS